MEFLKVLKKILGPKKFRNAIKFEKKNLDKTFAGLNWYYLNVAAYQF